MTKNAKNVIVLVNEHFICSDRDVNFVRPRYIFGARTKLTSQADEIHLSRKRYKMYKDQKA